MQNRLLLAVSLSLALMFFDHKLDSFSSVRTLLASLVSPIQYMANVPGQVLSWTAERITRQDQLLEENARLRRQHVLLSEAVQRVDMLQQENNQLRALLQSPVQIPVRKMVAELMAVDNDPYSHQIVINKGSIDGVYEGQPVLDESGVVGQILHVGTTNSRVLLIADLTHAIPVRVVRNNIRLIVSGSGQLNTLTLNHVPHSSDIRVGDLLVTSGLGNVFPPGYPVAKVAAIGHDESRPFASISAEPVAKLDRLKYLLLVWPQNKDEEQ